ncbi:zinc finger domain-containing protein, partial [Eschrichtius robustus]|nr:zinc finger domain-containing protein [Eschrichtius robustus]
MGLFRGTGAPGGQASPHLTLGPIILPPEQGLAPTLFLKALPIPLYHTVPPGGLQPRAPLVSGSVDGGSVPFILSPLLQPEGPGSTQVGKPAAPALTVNFVGALPILSPGLGPVLGSPGKVRNAGKYLCPHCGRDCLKPSVLEKHIRSHTGERPFPCATCGIAFKTQSNLYKHRRTQTHLNNSRLSSESDGGGSSLPEEGDKAGVPSGAHEARSERPLSPGAQAAGHCLLPTAHLSPVAKNLDLKLDAVACLGSTFDVREAPVDSAPGLPLASSQPRRKLPEQRSPTASRPGSALQPQQVEKPGDAKPSEGRLRKCESTDSGYLCRGPLCLGSKSPLLPPNGKLELGCQLLPAPSPPKGGDLEAPRRGLPDPKLEGGTRGGGGDAKETCQQDHVVPSQPGGSSGEPQPTEDKLPSERKKLKVEALSCHEPLGAERGTPGGPMQAASPPPQNQDSDPGEKPEPPGSCRAQGPFPSLRAEPRLTWCCLSRSLPLPMEQKEKNASVHLAPHFPGGSLRGEGPDAQPGPGG